MSHPLTDAICEELADTEDRPFTSIEMDNMRAAADWQLQKVVEWLEDNIDDESIITDLKEAMRQAEGEAS